MACHHRVRLWIVFTALLVIAGCTKVDPVPESNVVVLPSDEMESDLPVIDGILEPGEWDQADLYFFEDESELFLLHDDDHLYLAIRAVSDEMISANVFLASEENIAILHTSAALGTAVYQPAGNTWQKTRDFEWCCRSTIDNASTRAMREAFYHTDNWLGINTYNGTENELEYMIRLTGAEEFLAVNFLRVNNIVNKQVWPIGINDGPAQQTIGGFPDTMDFLPKNWQKLEEVPIN